MKTSSRLLSVSLTTSALALFGTSFLHLPPAQACSPPYRPCPITDGIFKTDSVLLDAYRSVAGRDQKDLLETCKKEPSLQSFFNYVPTIDLSKSAADREGPSKPVVANVALSRPEKTQFDNVVTDSCSKLPVDITTRACIEFSPASDTLTPAARLGYFFRFSASNISETKTTWDTTPLLSTTGRECLAINSMDEKPGTDSGKISYVENHPEPYQFTVQVVAIDGSGNETLSDPSTFNEPTTLDMGGLLPGSSSILSESGSTSTSNDSGGCSYGRGSSVPSGASFVVALGGLAALWIRSHHRRCRR